MKKHIYLVPIITLFVVTACKQKKEQVNAPTINKTFQYTNPIIPGDFADPSVIRVGETYYAVGTSSEWAPHFPIFTSKDLVNWEHTTYAFQEAPQWTSSSFWAPELFYHNNTYYLYYTARRKSDGVSYIGVATTKNIKSGFQDHGVLIEYGTEAIDAFVIEDNGKLIISWKAYGLDERPIEILAAELSADGLKLKGEPFTLLKDENLRGIEGQYMIKKDGYYYIFYSEGACCGSKCDYDVRIARAKTIEGPYEKYDKNPILTANKTWKCPGHGTLVKTNTNKWIYMYHAYSQKSGVFTGRQGLIDEIIWDEKSGWPIPKNLNGPSVKSNTPYNTSQKVSKDFKDTFSGEKLSKSWQWDFRNSEPSIVIKNNSLSLSGVVKEKNKAGTALTIRPYYGNYSIETGVSNTNQSLKGLTIYGDASQSIGVGVVDDEIKLWKIKDNNRQILSTTKVQPYTELQLKISMNNGECRFYWKSEGDWNAIKPKGNTPVNGSFLPQWDRSPRPGLIHTGDTDKPATFNYFKIEYPS